MSIILSQAQGKIPVTILTIQGDLDASNYQQVIASAKESYEAGARHLLFDMSDMRFMSSSGLVALHSVALIFQGKQPSDPENGWEAFHSIGRDQESKTQRFVKLLGPQPRVAHTLEISGMKEFFEVFTDQEAAVSSFE